MGTASHNWGQTAAAVLNGYVRDTKAILNMGFPTFGFGFLRTRLQPHAIRLSTSAFRLRLERCVCIPGKKSLATLMVSCWFPRKLRPKSSHARWGSRVAGELVRRAIEEGSGAVKAFEKYAILCGGRGRGFLTKASGVLVP